MSYQKPQYGPGSQQEDCLQRYEKALAEGRMVYLDEEEMELVIDHYFDQQRLSEATVAANYAIDLHPDSVSLRASLVKLLLMEKKMKDAETLLKPLVEEAPQNINVMLCHGEVLLYHEKEEEALKLFKSMLKSNAAPVDEICLSISFILADYELFDQANRYLTYGYTHGGSANRDLCFQRAVVKEQMGLHEEAITAYNEILDNDPYDNDAWFNLGQVYFALNRYDEALEAYDYASVTDRHDYQAFLQIAHCYFQKEAYMKAIEEYKKYAKLSGDDTAPLYIFIGECYEQMGMLDECYQYFSKATECDPDNPDGWAGLCIYEMRKGNHTAALEHVKHAISLNPDVKSYWMYLGDIFQELGEEDMALNAFKHAEAIFGEDNQELLTSIAEILIDKGQYDEAFFYTQKALRAEDAQNTIPELPVVHAIALYKTGQTDAALEWLSIALERDEKNKEAFFTICEEAQTDPRFFRFI
ncbi:MAG: tetratricopeptide repeat protein [Paludibacteraceae bacterium]|nr:tetratricopeptide repeat protein [Candidatus Physcocola equi]MCQ2235212.1 tetratricopeptide repeat protein [Paludibacteraceae bacterium]